MESIGFFGSYVKEENQKRSSDLDILVELSEPIRLFKFYYFLNSYINLVSSLFL